MTGLVGSPCKGKERPDGQGENYIHVIHMDQGCHIPEGLGALLKGLLQWKTVGP
jgi:hypothetical protein